MENEPLSPSSPAETSPNKKDSKKKKSSEALGSFAIEPSRNKDQVAEKSASIWQRPTSEHKDDIATDSAFAESKDKTSELTAHEAAVEAELSQLAPSEQEYVVRELAKAKLAEADHTSAEEPAAEQQAVTSFREKIVIDAIDSETALQETLAEVEAEFGDAPKAEQPAQTVESEALEDESEDVGDENATAATGSSGSGAGGSQPPRPPQNSGTAQPPSPGSPNLPPIIGPMPNRAVTPPVRPNSYAQPRHNRAADMLVGGIVGYLVGRRRGRIKTEKRLLPIQQKLEKQVLSLDREVNQKEAIIRQAVQEKQRQTISVAEQAQLKRPERQPAVSANLLHSAVAPERIGRMLVKAETPTERKSKVEPATPERALSINKHVETLTRNELLAISATISVEGSTLRQIYETHLVSERGLRRLVAEHLRGGNLQKALRREVVEREIDFERDPVMRDQPMTATAAATTTNLQTLLDKATKQLPGGGHQDSEVLLRAQTARQQAHAHQSQRNQKVATASLTTIIVALLAVVLYMVLTRG